MMTSLKKTIVENKLAAVIIVAGLSTAGYFLVLKKELPSKAKTRTESNLFSMGQVAANSGKHDEAVSIYQELLSKDPNHSIALRFMLESQMRLNDKEGILKSIEKLLSLDPSDKNIEISVSAYLQVGEKEKAEMLLKKLKDKSSQTK